MKFPARWCQDPGSVFPFASEARGGVMGLLTHHLVHDEAAWIFLDAFFAATARHPACRWATLADLTGGQGDPAQAPASSRS